MGDKEYAGEREPSPAGTVLLGDSDSAGDMSPGEIRTGDSRRGDS